MTLKTDLTLSLRDEVIEECAKAVEACIMFHFVRIDPDNPDAPWQPGSPYDRGQQEAAQKMAQALRALKTHREDMY